MTQFVRESLYEDFDDKNIETDEWNQPEEVENIEDVNDVPEVDSSDMDVDEIEVVDNDVDLEVVLDRELTFPEISRGALKFRVKGKPEIIVGIPMAGLNPGNYVFKVDGMMRKFNINNIDVEVFEAAGSKEKRLNENGYSYNNYLNDIATYLLSKPENVQAILDIHDLDDSESAKNEIADELENNEDIFGVKGMFQVGVQPEDAASKIVNNFQN